MATELGITDIQKIIPHRYPMLLLDRVIDLEIGKSATAVHNVSANDPFVHASSTTAPVFLAPLIIEAMAQTGAIALLSMPEFKSKTAYFGGIDDAEIYGQARPGDQIIIKTKLTKIKRNLGLGKATAEINGQKIVVANLTFMIG